MSIQNKKYVANIRVFLSEPRLAKFIEWAGSEELAIELHQESIRIGASDAGPNAPLALLLASDIQEVCERERRFRERIGN